MNMEEKVWECTFPLKEITAACYSTCWLGLLLQAIASFNDLESFSCRITGFLVSFYEEHVGRMFLVFVNISAVS